MANTREIRRRIRSVENTAKITNAIQLVAASKMRRAQDRALQARPYAERRCSRCWAICPASLAIRIRRTRCWNGAKSNETAVILITPDRGLCGGLIANLERHTGEIVLGPEAGGSGDISMIPVGRKGGDYFPALRDQLPRELPGTGRLPRPGPRRSRSRGSRSTITPRAASTRVLLVYASFINTVSQVPITVPILPVETAAQRGRVVGRDAVHFRAVAAGGAGGICCPRYVDLLVYQAVLEAAASEQSARMVAMRNATDAGERDDRRPHAGLQQGPPGADHVRAAGHHRRRRGAQGLSDAATVVSGDLRYGRRAAGLRAAALRGGSPDSG